jgi:hypothetical protein
MEGIFFILISLVLLGVSSELIASERFVSNGARFHNIIACSLFTFFLIVICAKY